MKSIHFNVKNNIWRDQFIIHWYNFNVLNLRAIDSVKFSGSIIPLIHPICEQIIQNDLWIGEKKHLKRTNCSPIQLLSSNHWLNGPITAILQLTEYKIELKIPFVKTLQNISCHFFLYRLKNKMQVWKNIKMSKQ